MGWLQFDSMWYVPSSFWQMRQIGGPHYGCTERHIFGCILPSLCGRACYFFSSRDDTSIFAKWVTRVFLDNAFLDQFLVFWTDDLKPLLI